MTEATAQPREILFDDSFARDDIEASHLIRSLDDLGDRQPIDDFPRLNPQTFWLDIGTSWFRSFDMLFSRRLKHSANLFLKKHGWEIQRAEPHLQDFLKQKGISLLLDVGANEGQFAQGIRARGYDQKIISFEPDPEAFVALQKNARHDAKWDTRNFAVGDKIENKVFNISGYSEFNSFLAPTDLLTSIDNRSKPEKTILTNIITIESIFDEIKNEKIFLKCDTQGYEKSVVLGAKNVIKRIVGLQLEIGLAALYENQPTLTEFIELMKSLNFGLAMLSANKYYVDDPVRTLEIDCVFLNLGLSQ